MNHNITKTNAQPVRNDDFYQLVLKVQKLIFPIILKLNKGKIF